MQIEKASRPACQIWVISVLMIAPAALGCVGELGSGSTGADETGNSAPVGPAGVAKGQPGSPSGVPSNAPPSGGLQNPIGGPAMVAPNGTTTDGQGKGMLLGACAVPTTAVALTRRMTQAELNNTLRDLLGETTRPADSLVAEERGGTFSNDPASVSVSPRMVEGYHALAEGSAARAVSNLKTLLPCDAATGDVCARSFIQSFGRRAFRRPLTKIESDRFFGLFTLGKETDFASGTRLVISAALQSPSFLYRPEFGQTPAPNQTVVRLQPYEMASRLSYLLWGTMPDEALLTAADQGRLNTPADVQRETERMLTSPKVKDSVMVFFEELLDIDRLKKLEKDAKTFGTLPNDLSGMFAEEMRRFSADAWASGTVGTFLTAPHAFLNASLAKHYGVTGAPATGYGKVTLDPLRASGVLSAGGLMSVLAKANQTSPVARGLFIRDQFLCTPAPPPPPDVDTEIPELAAKGTARERLSRHATNASCASCHRLFDPIGFAFETYDGVGRWRTMDAGKMIDTSGDLVGTDVDGPFAGVPSFGARISKSAQVASCVARRWLEFAVARAFTDADACSLAYLESRLGQGGQKLSALLPAVTDSFAFQNKRLP